MLLQYPSSMTRAAGDNAFRLLGAAPVPRSGGGSQSLVQDRDGIYVRSTGATAWDDYQLMPLGGGFEERTYESLTPAVATADSNGLVSRVSDGVAEIRCTIGGVAKTKKLLFRSVTGATTYIFQEFVEGSLGHYLSNQIDSRLAGKSASNALRLFTTQNHAAQTYVRNPNFWAADMAQQLTCLSPWNSRGGATRAGTAFTIQHITLAWHFRLFKGDTIRFVTADGTVITRTIVGVARVPETDICICTLNSALPETITPAKVLPQINPSGWLSPQMRDWLPRLSRQSATLPMLQLDQEEKGLIHDCHALGGIFYWNSPPLNAKRLEFYENLVTFDSGNVAGNFIGGDFVLFSTGAWTASSAPSSTRNDWINAAIAAADADAGVSTGLTCTPVDLSGFPTYPGTGEYVPV